MEKPILATNIDGLLIDHSAFVEPHKAWFDRAIKKTKDTSLEQWKDHPEYFKGVNQAMEKILPNASSEERTSQARTWYQEDVIQYIKKHQEVIKYETIDKLKALKRKYYLVLITTSTQKHVNYILEAANLQGIYDLVIASKTEQEPNKEELIRELIQIKGKPKYYLTGKMDEGITSQLKKLEIKVIQADEITKIK